MAINTLLVLAAAAAAAAAAALPAAAQIERHHCHQAVHFGPANTQAALDLAATPNATRLLARVTNGKLYEVTVPQVANGTRQTTTFKLLHVYGAPYDMGYATGKLMAAELTHFIDDVWRYLSQMVVENEPAWVPSWLRELIADVGLDVALDITERLSRRWTGEYFYDELRGMADATGVDMQTAVRVHMLAGLTQGHCSTFGAWGEATLDGRSLSMRALDWDMKGPFRDVPLVTVYHADAAVPGTPPGALSFVSVGFAGFVGGLTGMNERGVGITEIGVSYPDDSFGDQSRIGVPFIFLLRDILQFDASRAAGVQRMRDAIRTCDLILGVGDVDGFTGVQYSFATLNAFTDTNMRPDNDTWHFKIRNTQYWGMDWLCPGVSFVLGTQLRKTHGTLTATGAIANVVGQTHTGDLHIAVYDHHSRDIYVSFAAPHALAGAGENAYDRRFVRLHTPTLFAEPAGGM